MENKYDNFIKKANDMRDNRNVSLIEAYNALLVREDIGSFSDDELKSLLIILKKALALNVDHRPGIMKIVLVIWLILGCIGLGVCNMISISPIRGLCLLGVGFVTFKFITNAYFRIKDAQKNRERQNRVMEINIDSIAKSIKKRVINKELSEEIIKSEDKGNQEYIDKLFLLIDSLFPLVSYDKMREYGQYYFYLQGMYSALLEENSGGLDEELKKYSDKPELFAQKLEAFVDKLIEDTSIGDDLQLFFTGSRKREVKELSC